MFSLSLSGIHAISNGSSFNYKKENSIFQGVNEITKHLKSLAWKIYHGT